MNEQFPTADFNRRLDALLGIGPPQSAAGSEAALEERRLLEVAARLAEADFSGETRPAPELEAGWRRQSSRGAFREQTPARLRPFGRRQRAWLWAAAALVFLALLAVFNQPVIAAVARLFGYGYIEGAGFVQLDAARVLRGPVIQVHEGREISALRGLALPDKTTLWLDLSAAAGESDLSQPVEGAWLELADGRRLRLVWWQWSGDHPGQAELQFEPLPPGVNRVTLGLTQGWRLPLEWIPAGEAGIPAADVAAPYPSGGVAAPAGTAVGAQSPALQPCIEKEGLQFCVEAASHTPENLALLLSARRLEGRLQPGNDFRFLLDVAFRDQVLHLLDEQGRRYEAVEPPTFETLPDGRIAATLKFPPLPPASRRLTLVAPAFYAHTPLEQTLVVDLGPNPAPGKPPQVDQTVYVLGKPLHFGRASLEGDGVASLRLTLYSDPAPAEDGVMPLMLELGRPPGLDDLYGGGTDGERIRLSFELIGAVSGKKTGRLEIPIVGATLALLGPFEFTFDLPDQTLAATATPQVIAGGAFTPQPSPTPFSLESYHFTGRLPAAGEMLFSVVQGQNTHLYAASPHNGFALEQVAELPGQVYQVFLHPDRQGIDYLAGTQVIQDGFVFYRNASLYTLRFSESTPRWLASFPVGSSQNAGTEILASWSADGRWMLFRYSGYQPRPGETWTKIGWVDLACRQGGGCSLQFLDLPEGVTLFDLRFAPAGRRAAFVGANEKTGSGAPDLFLLEFDPHTGPGRLINLTHSDQVAEESFQWLPDGERLLAACWDPSIPMNEYDLCRYDIKAGTVERLLRLPFNMRTFTLAPDGGLLADIIAEKGEPMLRLFDPNTRQASLLFKTDWVQRLAFSPDQAFLAQVHGQGEDRLDVIPVQQPQRQPVLDAAGRHISWMEWVK